MNTTFFIRDPKRAKKVMEDVEQRYARLLASVTDYVYTVTVEQGQPVMISHGAGCEAVTGYASDEFEADPFLWESIIHPEDLATLRAHTDGVLDGQKPPPVELRLTHKKGQMRWVKHTTVAHRNELGQVIAYDGLVSDITERRLIEEQHRLGEQRLQAIMDHSPAIIHLKDLQGRYLLVNRRFEQLFGVKRGEVIGLAPHDLFGSGPADALRNHDRQVLAGGRPMEFDETLPHHGELHTYISVKFPLLDAAGAPYAVCGISTDITERKRAEEKLNRAYHELSASESALKTTLQELKAANEQLRAAQSRLIQAAKLESVGTLAAGVAHEVKNPLQIILIGLDYLDCNLKPGDADAPSVLADMREAVTRADKIIYGLLEFAAPGEFKLKEEDLNALIEQSMLLISGQAVTCQVEVIRDLDPSLPLVRIDRSKMQQVFLNLFINAMQAMPRGGVITARTRAGRCDEGLLLDRAAFPQFAAGEPLVKVEVQDTGTGIAEDHLGKLFDPFFTTKPVGVGSGLGLSVVKKIVDLHGGAIDIRNAPQRGAIVTLVLRTRKDKTT
ncbi:MAG TPA: PAS domain S-box protein [Candidatus Acidoferrum sp.]|nr:PAS domain S-box protein [Candidatus Acidoferrum sp.]